MEYCRVLCVGDSLGLPRQDISYEQTWFFLLKNLNKNMEFVPRFERALTSNMICGSNSKDYLEFYSPSIVILQIGIVDCSPRYLKTGSFIQKLLASMPAPVQRLAWVTIKRTMRRSPRFADVSITEFSQNIKTYFNRCQSVGVKKLVAILIGVPGADMVVKNPLIKEQVKKYNHAMEDAAKNYDFIQLINPLGVGEDSLYLGDGYHLSNAGHLKVLEQVKSCIDQ